LPQQNDNIYTLLLSCDDKIRFLAVTKMWTVQDTKIVEGKVELLFK